jgi:hypothetical protein
MWDSKLRSRKAATGLRAFKFSTKSEVMGSIDIRALLVTHTVLDVILI